MHQRRGYAVLASYLEIVLAAMLTETVIGLFRDRSTPSVSSPALTWGSTPAERELPYPCDRYLPHPHGAYFRAVDVDAPAAIIFHWLCQLRVTPYSYDWIDNLGRRSPQTLTPGLEQLELGQTFMTMFELVEFERDRHLTLLARRFRWAFGEVSVTYMVVPAGENRCRLIVKLLGNYPHGRVGRLLLQPTMPWLDLFMMRRQLLNLKALAERDARA
jgi:hypothetical protein